MSAKNGLWTTVVFSKIYAAQSGIKGHIASVQAVGLMANILL